MFLADLHRIVRDWPQLALVVFDCKPKVATAEHGATLLREIRNRLTYDNDLNVIISVSSRAESAICADFANLGTRSKFYAW